MRQGLTYFHETIFPSLPVFYRRIDTALAQIGQPKLPLDHNLFRFGSWMGGDRDGGCPLWQSMLCCLVGDYSVQGCLLWQVCQSRLCLAALSPQSTVTAWLLCQLAKLWQCVTLIEA